MTLREIADIVGGRVVDATGDEVVSGAAFLDSRAAVSGGLFVAIEGEHVDGHDFALAAVEAGAVAAMTTREVGSRAVVVDDTVEALGTLARHVIAAFPSLYVVGITGSQGKTSTKDLIAQVLEQVGETVAPTESFNNEIGVPLTALRASESTRFLVVEMGSRGRGHLTYLTSITPPNAAVVLNVGVAHLGEFGTQDDIAVAKGELVEALPADGVAVLNGDDHRVALMRDRTAATVVTFGTGDDVDVRVSNIGLDGIGHVGFEVVVAGESRRLELPLVGEHQASNAAAVLALATAMGLDLDATVAVLQSARPRSKWRMDIATTSNGVTVINDAYNANPDSMQAALKTLADVGHRRGPGARTFAVLGEMLELGDTASAEHAAIGRLAARLDVSHVVSVGADALSIHFAAAESASWGGEPTACADAEEALAFLRGALRPGDVVLVKASRAVGLEQLALALLDEAGLDTAMEAEA